MKRKIQNLIISDKPSNRFYLIFVTTILIMRFLVFLVPNVDIMLGPILIHHAVFGAILLLFSLALKKSTFKLVLFAIGLGLVIDQATFLIIRGVGDADYWSPISLIGTIAFIVLIRFTKDRIIK